MKPQPRLWLPLITQQLRLRNLTRIQGINIGDSDNSDSGATVYYTLHYEKESAAFYTSEALSQNLQQKWAEIVCPEILKSNKNCVMVRVWQKSRTWDSGDTTVTDWQPSHGADLRSVLPHACLSPKNLPRPPDKLLFSWAVYFSGLVMLAHTDINLSKNSLIFQINGAYFASPEHVTVTAAREDLTPIYQRYPTSSVDQNTSINTTFMSDLTIANSPSSQICRGSSPICNDQQKQTLKVVAKSRYQEVDCLRSDIRCSYDLEKLLCIQETQRLQLQKLRESEEIAADIRQLSLRCITSDQLKRRARSTSSNYSFSISQHHHHHLNYHSMGRKLSVLLAEDQHIEPAMLLRAQKLQQQVETLRCRRDLLLCEQKTYKKNIAELESRLAKLVTGREELQTCLQARITQLDEDKSVVGKHYEHHLQQLQLRRHVVQNVERRMSSLCLELQEIYPIGRSEHGFHTICGVPFPNIGTLLSDIKSARSISLEHISPLAMSASAGYIAHLVQMIAVIIDRPLRNTIIHEGSRTKVRDNVKDIPYGSKDFPLYTRSSLPSKLVKYALFLLNQNIAQLCYDITGIRCDLRATIENLLLIFKTLAEIEQSTHIDTRKTTLTHPKNRLSLHGRSENGSVKSAVDSIHNTDDIDGISKSHSSIDMPITQLPSTMLLRTPNASESLEIRLSFDSNNVNQSDQRVSRSVGSYSDGEEQQFKNIVERCYSNSDSNIAFRRDHADG